MDVKGNATPKEPGDPGTPGTPDAKPEQIQPPANLHQDRIVRGPDGSILVYSTKEPEEVFMFGLHLGSDSEIVREPTVQYVHPFERSIKEPLESGLCIFCQLILSPDPPAHAQHYPSFQLLLDSKGCDMCKVVTSSLSQGCPELQELYNNGYPPLYDRENSSTAIFVDCRKHPHHTRIVARCGAGLRFQGKYVVWSTEERLGESIFFCLVKCWESCVYTPFPNHNFQTELRENALCITKILTCNMRLIDSEVSLNVC